ncbi:MAG: hypothetical protein QW100_03075 [Thermoplasmatales archaeon]
MDTFDRKKYAVSDIKRGIAMIAAFVVAAFLGFMSGLLQSIQPGAGFIGWIMLFVVLIVAIYIVYRSPHETKRNSDYLIAFFVAFLSFIGFWIIALNIPP